MDARSVFDVAFGLGARVSALLALTAIALVLLRRASAATRHLVAVAGLAGALTLPLLSGALPALELEVLPAQATAPRTAHKDLGPGDERLSVEPALAVESTPTPGVHIVERARKAGQLLLVGWVVLAWMSVTLLLLARLGAGLLRLARIDRDGEPETHLAAEVSRCSDALRLRRFVRLVRSPDVQVPMTAGVVDPVVILPESSLGWTAERRRFVLLHELAHVKRLDWLSLLVSEVATAFWWFHPLAWVALRAARLEAEKATDDLVVRAGEKPSAYAGHLIEIVRALRGDPRVVAAMPMARPSDLEGRLRALLDRKGHGPASMAGRGLAVGLVATALALAVVRPVRAAQVDDEPELAFVDEEVPIIAAKAAAEALESTRIALAPLHVRVPAIKVRGPMVHVDVPEIRVDVPEIRFDLDEAKLEAARAQIEAGGERMRAAMEQAQARIEESRARMEEGRARMEKERARIEAGKAHLDAEHARLQAKLDAANERRLAGNRFTWHGSPSDDASAYGQGIELHRRGDYQAAIREFQRAIERGEREDAASYNIACGYARLGDRDRAFEWLAKARDAGFDLRHMLDSDDDLESLRGDARFKQLREESTDDRADRRRALARFERVQKASPKSPSPWSDAGTDLLHAGEYDASARAFQEAASRSTRPGNPLYNAACALSRKGDKGAALDLLEKAIDAGFDNAHLLETDEDLDNVRKEPRFKDLVKLAQDVAMPSMSFADRLNGLFGTHAPRRSAEESVARLEAATREHPTSGRAFFGLGMAQLQREDFAAAARAFGRALELGYRKPVTLYNLACVEARRDDRDKAFRYLDQAIEAGFDAAGQLRSDDDLDNLRGDPRFRDAIRKADARRTRAGRDE